MPLGLDFMPLDQILNMSLNGLRRQFATQNKTIIDPHMDEPFISLDLGHQFHLSGPLHRQFVMQKKSLLEDLRN
jgi:hypothetical protein